MRVQMWKYELEYRLLFNFLKFKLYGKRIKVNLITRTHEILDSDQHFESTKQTFITIFQRSSERKNFIFRPYLYLNFLPFQFSLLK